MKKNNFCPSYNSFHKTLFDQKYRTFAIGIELDPHFRLFEPAFGSLGPLETVGSLARQRPCIHFFEGTFCMTGSTFDENRRR
jgi:hypothetical protein